MACILRVVGRGLALDECLTLLDEPPDRIWRKGEPRAPGPSAGMHTDSGISLIASEGDEIAVQIVEAKKFIDGKRRELRALTDRPDVEATYLDFAWHFPIGKQAPLAQFRQFPNDLLHLCAELGLAIEISVYATSDDDSLADSATPIG